MSYRTSVLGLTLIAPLLLTFLLVGCVGNKKTSQQNLPNVQRDEPGANNNQADQNKTGSNSKQEPAYITVQHILIGFRGSVPEKPVTRSKSQAEKLAQEILEKANAGEDFDALVKKYTDDSHPGIYNMANTGSPGDMTNPDPAKRVYPRDQMVPAFGDTGFPLEVGEVGLAGYDPFKSKYGWHIVKRIK